MSKYVFNGVEFPTQAAVKSHIREIVNRYPDTVFINANDFRFMLDVLRRHPDAADKIGRGVSRMWIERDTERGSKNRHFVVERIDLSNENFGWTKCLKGVVARASLPSQRFKDAARRAVECSVMAFRENFFAETVNPVCPVMDTPLSPANCDVHHVYPFDDLLADYVTLRGIDVQTVSLDGSGEGQAFVDEVLIEDWRQYHDDHATLRVLSKEGHRELKRNPSLLTPVTA